MSGSSDPQRRPVLYDLKNQRLLADPVVGSRYVVIPAGPGGGDGDVTISLINTATSAVILAARVTAASVNSPGVVQLEDGVGSTSVTRAATANAVKLAHDVAANALPRSGGTLTGDVTLDAGVALVFEGTTADAYQTRLAAGDPSNNWVINLPDGSGTVGLLELAQVWGGAQRGAVTVLSSAASVTINLAASNHFQLTLAHNVTLANPLNAVAGQSGVIEVTQASSGGPYTLQFGSAWAFAGGVPSLSSVAGTEHVLAYYVSSAGTVWGSLLD